MGGPDIDNRNGAETCAHWYKQDVGHYKFNEEFVEEYMRYRWNM